MTLTYTEKGAAALYGVVVVSVAMAIMTTAARAGRLMSESRSPWGRGNTVRNMKKNMDCFVTRSVKKAMQLLVAACAR